MKVWHYHKDGKVSQMVTFTHNGSILSNYGSTPLCDPISKREIPRDTHFSTFLYTLKKFNITILIIRITQKVYTHLQSTVPYVIPNQVIPC